MLYVMPQKKGDSASTRQAKTPSRYNEGTLPKTHNATILEGGAVTLKCVLRGGAKLVSLRAWLTGEFPNEKSKSCSTPALGRHAPALGYATCVSPML